MEWGLTSKVVGLVIDLGYYLGRPYRWDPHSNQLVDIQTIWEFTWWILGVLVNTIPKIIIILGVIRDLLGGRIDLTNDVHTTILVMSIVYVWSTVFDFHTIYRRKELRIFVNTELSYFKMFIEKYSRTDIKPKRNWSPIFLAALIIALLFLPFGCALIYIVRCDLHVFAPLFTTCAKDSNNLFGDLQKSIGFNVVMALIAILFILHNVSTAFIYLVMGAPWGFVALDIFNELVLVPPEESATLPALKTVKEMVHNYKCFQLILIMADKIFFDCIAPFILVITILLNIGLLYCMIRVEMALVHLVAFAVFELLLLSIYALIFGRLAIIQEVSKSILDTWKHTCTTTYRSVRHNSLAVIQISIGGFYYLDRQIVIAICETIIGKTSDLLLLNPA